MRRLAPAFPVALLAVTLHGQAIPSPAIPATPPTRSVSDLPSAHPAVNPAGQAVVNWDGSILTIQAKGDSLHNIIRAVSQSTGMKVSGGVPEEPVFGSYGPGSVQDVLPQLFDGIAVNMMLVNDSATKPKELLLTARNGAATPPQTRTIADEDQGFRRRPVTPGPQSGFDRPRPGMGNGAPPLGGQPPQPQALPTDTAAPAAATTSTDANGQPQSPNGTRTPEQIFEELRKRAGMQSSTPSQ